MAIEITGIPNTATPATQRDNNATGAARSSTDQTVSNNSGHNATVDDVTITQDARNLIKIEADVDKQSEVDHNRVASLKLEIDAGRYNIDPARVAEKFLQFETMLAV